MLVIYQVDTGEIRQISQNTPSGEVPAAMIPDGCAALKTKRSDVSGVRHQVNPTGQIINKSVDAVEAHHTKAAWWEFRARRNHLLSGSDWTQLADAQVDQVAWRAYRQLLRDLPNTVTNPRNINWPEAPV